MIMEKKSTTNPRSNGLFEKLASQAISRQYSRGQAIFSQGDAADAIFRIEQGNVKLAVASTRSNKASISILREGDCFGEACMVDDSFRTCTATSIQKSTIGRISKRAMVQRLRRQPAFAKIFAAYLLLRLGRVEEDLINQLVNDSEHRLARLLLQLTDSGKSSGHAAAVMNVDQGTLAQVVGTTRSRVSHFMNQFRKKGFIDYNGSLQVHDALQEFLLESRPTQ
jgi:CRP/FNR family transcriptional regulator, cyclic AMP receptor protein